MEPNCEPTHQAFFDFSLLMSSYVSKLIQTDGFYNTNYQRAPFTPNAGRSYSYFIFGRAAVVGDTFANFGDVPAEGSTCDPNNQEVKFGNKKRSVTYRQYSQSSDFICLDDLLTAWDINQQLANTTVGMSQISKFTWENEYQNTYIQLSEHKLVADADLTSGSDTTSSASFPNVEAQYTLTFGLLERIYQKLIIRYGGVGAAGYDGDNRPIFNLVGDTQTFQNLKMSNSNPNIRDIVQWAFATDGNGSPLLGTPGMSSKNAWLGWKFNTVDFPARYDFVDGQYVQIFPMISEPGAEPSNPVWDINPDWENAPYTVSVAFLSNVLKHLVVKPQNYPQGYQYSAAQNWAGEFMWRKEAISKACNRNGNKGWWESNYKWAPQTLRTDDLSYVVMHKRCKPPLGLYECDAYGPVTSGS